MHALFCTNIPDRPLGWAVIDHAECFHNLVMVPAMLAAAADPAVTLFDDAAANKRLSCRPYVQPDSSALCEAEAFRLRPMDWNVSVSHTAADPIDGVIVLHYSLAKNRRCHMITQLQQAGLPSAWPRLLFTHHVDYNRVPLSAYEACTAGWLCELFKSSKGEMTAGAVLLAFYWAASVAARSNLRTVLFLEDDAQLAPGFANTVRGAVQGLNHHRPDWRYLGLCKLCHGGNLSRDLSFTTHNHFIKIKAGPCLCSRGFLLSARGIREVFTTLAPSEAVIDGLMLKFGPHAYYVHAVDEGSKNMRVREVAALGRPVSRGTDLWEGACMRVGARRAVHLKRGLPAPVASEEEQLGWRQTALLVAIVVVAIVGAAATGMVVYFIV